MNTRSASAKNGIVVAAIISGLAIGDAATGQSERRLLVDLTECVDLVSPEQRFACYERRVSEARPQSANAVSPPAADTAARARRAEQSPSADDARSSRRAEREVDASADDAAEPGEIVAKITDLRETIPNSFVITLDNGQVWRQTRPKRYPMRPGQSVRIYPTRWGDAFRLTAADLNSFIAVERIR